MLARDLTAVFKLQLLHSALWCSSAEAKAHTCQAGRSCTRLDGGKAWLEMFPVMTADIKMQWGDKKHELNVSTYHMCILLLFNEADRHSYQDILTATVIPAGDLKRALQSLALVKVSLCVCVSVSMHGCMRLSHFL